MNLSNKLTLSRFALAFAMTILLSFPIIPFGKTMALAVLAVAAMTDYLDGKLARSGGQVTAFGQFMDPLADKVLVCAAFICFVSMRQIVPAWIVVAIITREFMVTGLRLMAASRGVIIAADFWGKHKTIWQLVVIITIVAGQALREDILPMLVRADRLERFMTEYYTPVFNVLTYCLSAIVAVLTIVSGSLYFWRSRELVMRDA